MKEYIINSNNVNMLFNNELILNNDSMPRNSRIFIISPNEAIKLYQGILVSNENNDHYKDKIMIEKLLKKQEKIKLSEFPYGIVKFNSLIKGQIMPYYKNTVNLKYLKKENVTNFNPCNIYIKTLKIIEELYNNDIYFLDINNTNFLLDSNDLNRNVHIIDFDPEYISIDNKIEDTDYIIFSNYCMMVNSINRHLELYDICDLLYICSNFDVMYKQLEEMNKNIKKKIL